MDPDPERRAENCVTVALLALSGTALALSFITGKVGSVRVGVYRISSLPFSYLELVISIAFLAFGFGYPPLRTRWWLCLPTIGVGVFFLIWSRVWKLFW
jgi:hypothetical protein